MKKFCVLLCLVAVSFSMAACGNSDVQAQMPAGQAETLMEERTSLSEISEEPGDENVSFEDIDSTETEAEGMSESAITDEAESMTGLVTDAGEAESETVTEPEAAAESETVSVPETAPETTGAETGAQNGVREENVMNMNVQVSDAVFSATLEENEAVTAFMEMMREGSVVIQMSDYSGFEKVGPLGTSLPASNSQTTTHAGDIVLYNGNQIVIFYGSNSWSYTRLGHIDDLTGWEEALGNGDVTVTFSLE